MEQIDNKTLWILEDDPSAQFVYEEILKSSYQVKLFPTISVFKEALWKTHDEKKPDLIISDLRLPDGSFLSFLNSNEGKIFVSTYSFLVVSSIDEMDALRICFNQGAIDYLTKPFGKCELLVKIQKVFATAPKLKTALSGEHAITVDLVSMTVLFCNKKSEGLTPKEVQILTYLYEIPQHTATRSDIIKRIWGKITVTGKTFDVHLVNLRKKLIPLELEIQYQYPSSYRLLHSVSPQTTG